MELLDLPLEIYTVFCQQLSIADIKQVRLTCRSLGIAGAPELFRQRQVALTSSTVARDLSCTIQRRPLLHYVRHLNLELTPNPETWAFEQLHPFLQALGHVHITDLSGQNFDWFLRVAMTGFFRNVGVSFAYNARYGVSDRMANLLNGRHRGFFYQFRLLHLTVVQDMIKHNQSWDSNVQVAISHANEVHADDVLKSVFVHGKDGVWKLMLQLAPRKLVLDTCGYSNWQSQTPPIHHLELQPCDFGANLTVLEIIHVGRSPLSKESTLTINSSGLRYLKLHGCFRWLQGEMADLKDLDIEDVKIKDSLQAPKLNDLILAFTCREAVRAPHLFDQCLSGIKLGASQSPTGLRVKVSAMMFYRPLHNSLVDPISSLKIFLEAANKSQARTLTFDCTGTDMSSMYAFKSDALQINKILGAFKRLGAAVRSVWGNRLSLQQIFLSGVHLCFDLEIGIDIKDLNDAVSRTYGVTFELHIEKRPDNPMYILGYRRIVSTTTSISLAKLHNTAALP